MKRTAVVVVTATVVAGILAVSIPALAAALEYDTISEGETNFYRIRLQKNVTYTIGVMPSDDDCDFDLFLFNAAGDLCTRDVSLSGYCLIQWRPRATQVFTIAVHSCDGDGAYLLMVEP